MSNNDISRFLFQPAKHYTGMRMQQGRVLLDSDYNEGAAHGDEDQRKTLLELIGPQATPDFTGFLIGTVAFITSDVMQDFLDGAPVVRLKPGDQLGYTSIVFNGDSLNPVRVPNYFIAPGAMYVGGLRVELEKAEFIAYQADYLQASGKNMPNMFIEGQTSASSGTEPVVHVFFLHVWEQWVSAVEDDEFLEHALGGPDTSLRVRRMRRVEFAFGDQGVTCADALENILGGRFAGLATFDAKTGELISNGRLKLSFSGTQSQDTCAPCEPSTTGRYLGAENQAIRIMLTSESTYVWAFDDGAPLYKASFTNVGSGVVTVRLLTLPKDEEHWPQTGRVIQILPWSAELQNGEKVADEIGVMDDAGVFCTVATPYNPDDNTFTLNTSNDQAAAKLAALIHVWEQHFNDAHSDFDDSLNTSDVEPRPFYVRFWHQTDGTNPDDIEISVHSGNALGNTGLIPDFTVAGLPGDYWIAAVRPETPNRIVPERLMIGDGAPPLGPRNFYAPLAVMNGTIAAQSEFITINSITDCRRHMVPVTDMGCCTIIVGDGVNSFGQFDSIQDAINALPPEGGHICVRPGLYTGEISIAGRTNITITGCGDLTVIQSSQAASAPILFEVTNKSEFITIQSLKIRAFGQVGLGGGLLGNCRFIDLAIEGADTTTGSDEPGAPLASFDLSAVRFEDCLFTAFGQVGVQMRSGGIELVGVSISSSSLASVPAQSALDLDADSVLIKGGSFSMFNSSVLSNNAVLVVRATSGIIEENRVTTTIASSGPCWGGIHLKGGSSNVTLRGNSISGGAGHGITLGSVTWNIGDPPTNTLIEPVGTSLMNDNGTVTGNLTGGFVGPDGQLYYPLCDPALVDIDIIDNDIEGMGTNGISVISLFGFTPFGPIVNLNGTCRILNNRIRNNLTNLSPTAPIATNVELPVGGTRPPGVSLVPPTGGTIPEFPTANIPLQVAATPFAGIVLGGDGSNSFGEAPLHLEIQGNIIEDNGIGENATGLPISGIVVLAGSNVTIGNNQIARNGTLTDASDNLLPGLRAGIAVLIAGGPVGTLPEIDAFFNDSLVTAASLTGDRSLRIFGNKVAQREGRALYAVGTGSMAIQNNHLSSQGFHGSQGSNAEVYAIGDVVYVQDLGRPWESFNVTEELGVPPGLVLPFGVGERGYLVNDFNTHSINPGEPLFFVGFGGHLVFDNNQVVYDWAVKQLTETEPLSFAPVTLASLDHVGAHSNSFGFRLDLTDVSETPLPIIQVNPDIQGIGGRPVFAHVLAVGFSVDICNNRVAESLASCEQSIVSVGFHMNSTMANVTTHCAGAFGWNDQSTGRLQTVQNMSLLVPADTNTCNDQPVINIVSPLAHDFFALLYDLRA